MLYEEESGEEQTVSHGKPKRRQNHNEVERRRRLQQRNRLMELKDVIPTIQTEKISTVLVLTKAREYIESLHRRVQELESHLMAMHRNPPFDGFQGYQQHQPIQPQPQPQPTLAVENVGTNPDLELRKENEELRRQLEELVGAKDVFLKRKSAADEDFNALKNFYESRRESSFQFPLNYDIRQAVERHGSFSKFLEPQRENSLTASFLAYLPPLLDDSQNTEQSNNQAPESVVNVKCEHCHKNFDGSVMVDCDTCHSWYHAKCVGIEESQIPDQWICPKQH